MKKVTEANLEKLHAAYQEEGDISIEIFEEVFETDDQDAFDTVMSKLSDKYPDIYRPAEEDAPKSAKDEEPDFFLRTEDGLLQELVLVSDKKGRILFAPKPQPKPEPVQIVVGGQQITVDLTALKAQPKETKLHGKTVEQLIVLAEAAK